MAHEYIFKSIIDMHDVPCYIPVGEIIRCKDCKHWIDTGKDVCSCERDALLREKDFFCAACVKKDGDGE